MRTGEAQAGESAAPAGKAEPAHAFASAPPAARFAPRIGSEFTAAPLPSALSPRFAYTGSAAAASLDLSDTTGIGTFAGARAPAARRSFSSADLGPRRSVFETNAHEADLGDDLAFNLPLWQRLSEYRTRDRVRVMTLWESGASAISLQTNHHGAPYLQWTSQWTNRGAIGRGLLDRWSPVSFFRGLTHSPSAAPARAGAPSAVPHPEIGAIP